MRPVASNLFRANVCASVGDRHASNDQTKRGFFYFFFFCLCVVPEESPSANWLLLLTFLLQIHSSSAASVAASRIFPTRTEESQRRVSGSS